MAGTSNLLIESGLSEEQALIYEALLDRGPQRASALSEWTGLKRGLTYKVLEQLEAVGLAEKKGGKGSVAVFTAGHPSLLLANIDRREKELSLAKEMLDFSIGALSSKYNLIAGRPNVQFYEGSDAIKKLTADLPKKDKEIRQMMDMQLAMKKLPEDTVSHLKKRISLEITKKLILSGNQFNLDYARKGTEFTEFKIAQNTATFPAAILVYDDKVSMMTLDQNQTVGFIIEDKKISDTMKILFDGYWGSLPKEN